MAQQRKETKTTMANVKTEVVAVDSSPPWAAVAQAPAEDYSDGFTVVCRQCQSMHTVGPSNVSHVLSGL